MSLISSGFNLKTLFLLDIGWTSMTNIKVCSLVLELFTISHLPQQLSGTCQCFKIFDVFWALKEFLISVEAESLSVWIKAPFISCSDYNQDLRQFRSIMSETSFTLLLRTLQTWRRPGKLHWHLRNLTVLWEAFHNQLLSDLWLFSLTWKMRTLKLFLLIRWAWLASSFFTWTPWRSILSRTCRNSSLKLPDRWHCDKTNQVPAFFTSFMVTDSLRLLSSSLLTVLDVWLWLLDSLVISAWIPLTTPSISTWCTWNTTNQQPVRRQPGCCLTQQFSVRKLRKAGDNQSDSTWISWWKCDVWMIWNQSAPLSLYWQLKWWLSEVL